jgi:hypothetical protein
MMRVVGVETTSLVERDSLSEVDDGGGRGGERQVSRNDGSDRADGVPDNEANAKAELYRRRSCDICESERLTKLRGTRFEPVS